jgi:hypothetical protein
MSAFHLPFFCGLQLIVKKEPSGCPRAMAKIFVGKDVKSFIQMAFCSYRPRRRTPNNAPVGLFASIPPEAARPATTQDRDIRSSGEYLPFRRREKRSLLRETLYVRRFEPRSREAIGLPNALIVGADRSRLLKPRGWRRHLFPAAKSLHPF